MTFVAPHEKNSRKFKELTFYDKSTTPNYYLLPFRFHKINDTTEVIVNEVGDYLLLPIGTAERIISRKIDKTQEEELYGDLIANFFISEEAIPPLIDVYATRYRTKKSFLEGFTSLHIFVVSLRCEHTCHYCQVSRVTADKDQFDMSKEYLDKGIEFMMLSPSSHVTMEFQGGEALLAFDNIVYAVAKAKEAAKQNGKTITFVICTNLAVVTYDTLEYCKQEEILISTSLDGTDYIHNENRKRPGKNSYELAVRGIEMCREVLGKDGVSALMTTSNLSLEYPVEIVEEYYNRGFRNIFLRPISPYGFAIKNEKKNKYESEKFLNFYKKALDRILEYNFNGEFFMEDYATILLQKIMTPFPVRYVDLNSPTGCITNVIVFNYDGSIYASDESRMLAEMKDTKFKLGQLNTHTYDDIFYGSKSEQIVTAGINESLPGCSDCAFQTYCGADPIHNHATQGDMYGYRPTSSFCHKNMEIIRHLFDLMNSDERVFKIFESWVNR